MRLGSSCTNEVMFHLLVSGIIVDQECKLYIFTSVYIIYNLLQDLLHFNIYYSSNFCISLTFLEERNLRAAPSTYFYVITSNTPHRTVLKCSLYIYILSRVRYLTFWSVLSRQPLPTSRVVSLQGNPPFSSFSTSFTPTTLHSSSLPLTTSWIGLSFFF